MAAIKNEEIGQLNSITLVLQLQKKLFDDTMEANNPHLIAKY